MRSSLVGVASGLALMVVVVVLMLSGCAEAQPSVTFPGTYYLSNLARNVPTFLGKRFTGLPPPPQGSSVVNRLTRGLRSVAHIGDWNGDGFNDFAIGVPTRMNSDSTMVGGVFILFGRQSAFGGDAFDISTSAGTSGSHTFVRVGQTGSGFGYSLAGGDVDGDGLSDLVIGAPTYGSSGAVFIVYGRQSTSSSPPPTDITADESTSGSGNVVVSRITGAISNSRFGHAIALVELNTVSSGGDADSARPVDLVIGAPGPLATQSGAQSGEVWTLVRAVPASADQPRFADISMDAPDELTGVTIHQYTLGLADHQGFGVALCGGLLHTQSAVGTYGFVACRNLPNGASAPVPICWVVSAAATGSGSTVLPESIDDTSPTVSIIRGTDTAFSCTIAPWQESRGSGIRDIVLGLPKAVGAGADLAEGGAVYRVPFSALGGVDVSLASLAAKHVVRGSVAGQWFGYSVSGCSNALVTAVTGGASGALMVGSLGPLGAVASSPVYVLDGGGDTFNRDLAQSKDLVAFEDEGIALGYSVSCGSEVELQSPSKDGENAGDLNNDGFADMLMLSMQPSPTAAGGTADASASLGMAFLVSGQVPTPAPTYAPTRVPTPAPTPRPGAPTMAPTPCRSGFVASFTAVGSSRTCATTTRPVSATGTATVTVSQWQVTGSVAVNVIAVRSDGEVVPAVLDTSLAVRNGSFTVSSEVKLVFVAQQDAERDPDTGDSIAVTTSVTVETGGCPALNGTAQVQFDSAAALGTSDTVSMVLVRSTDNCLTGKFSNVTAIAAYEGSECVALSDGEQVVTSSSLSVSFSVDRSMCKQGGSDIETWLVAVIAVSGVVVAAFVTILGITLAKRAQFARAEADVRRSAVPLG